MTSLLDTTARNMSYDLFSDVDASEGSVHDGVCLYNAFILSAIGLVFTTPVAVPFLKQLSNYFFIFVL